ncbi:hypothetical protein GCM10011387_03410 [Pedobacter quisquiliarum]|uniref:Uncharacterized protein n=1 Tax=Pedobacter quisquiliarum TaxID=1834438 RepID=A0A916TYV6_9SPHI|nr:hypothetical protein [Pedobacter quisquiliarum]GGC53206.1 hypothetical protein GCM10011387_03410 [Pedobacter quisquiliarum]
MLKEVEVTSIEAYLNLIKQSKVSFSKQTHAVDFLFRGQTIDYPLIPKICRLKAKGDLLKRRSCCWKNLNVQTRY